MAKSLQLYNRLRERIISGEYSPGYRLVVDGIASEFGVSAGPVREALRLLEGNGLIDHARNQGATVAGIDERSFIDVSEVMALLEARATALAAATLDADDIAHLRARNEAMRIAAERGEMGLVSEVNRDFHEYIYARCTSDYLRVLISNSWDRLQIGYRLVFERIPVRHHESVAEHEALITLIDQSAPAAEIERAVESHKLRTIEDLDSADRDALTGEPV